MAATTTKAWDADASRDSGESSFFSFLSLFTLLTTIDYANGTELRQHVQQTAATTTIQRNSD